MKCELFKVFGVTSGFIHAAEQPCSSFRRGAMPRCTCQPPTRASSQSPGCSPLPRAAQATWWERCTGPHNSHGHTHHTQNTPASLPYVWNVECTVYCTLPPCLAAQAASCCRASWCHATAHHSSGNHTKTPLNIFATSGSSMSRCQRRPSPELAVLAAVCPLLALDGDQDAAGATIIPAGHASTATGQTFATKIIDCGLCSSCAALPAVPAFDW